ncbi:MAG: DUF4422 domain-containing protein [Hungatella sp.]|nr:DUF4422 domain-containing protein [Hungatella sp.]
MKVIVWGLGEVYNRYKDKMNLNNIVGLVDNSIEKRIDFGEKQVISPFQLSNYEYDYIVIFSSKYYEEISYQLIMELGIDCKKILRWEYYLGNEVFGLFTIHNIINKFCKQYHVRELLDVGGILSRNQILNIEDVYSIDLLYGTAEKIFFNNYSCVYKTYTEIKKQYDLLLTDELNYNWISFQSCLTCSEKILIIIPFNNLEDLLENNSQKIDLVNFSGYLFGYINKNNKKAKIFEVTHKNFIPINEQTYIPIHAGCKQSLHLGFMGDDTGDHISYFNSKINECTALYWIWKNADYEILGLNHYRRFFKSEINSYMLQKIEVELLMEQYDIVVATSSYNKYFSIEQELKRTVCEEAFKRARNYLDEIFNALNKEENTAFRYVFQGHVMFPCNMFITSRKILDEYCNWLFPKLFELIDNVTINEKWDTYSKRIIGFIAERLLTVWIVQQNYRIKELPILLMGDGRPFGK